MPLEFNEERHEYTLDDKRLPSVTQVLNPWSQLAGVPDHLLEPYRQRGHDVHLATQLDDEGDLDEDSVPELMGYVRAWRKFRADFEFETHYIELRVYHPMLLYAGTLDRYGAVTMTVGRKRVKVPLLLDIKSGVGDRTHGPQTAAYLAALATRHHGADVARRACVYLADDGTYKTEFFGDYQEDFGLFVAALTIMRWKEKHGVQ